MHIYIYMCIYIYIYAGLIAHDHDWPSRIRHCILKGIEVGFSFASWRSWRSEKMWNVNWLQSHGGCMQHLCTCLPGCPDGHNNRAFFSSTVECDSWATVSAHSSCFYSGMFFDKMEPSFLSSLCAPSWQAFESTSPVCAPQRTSVAHTHR